MNRRETVDIAFLVAVVVVLAAAFIYVNLPGDEEEAEEDVETDISDDGEADADVAGYMGAQESSGPYQQASVEADGFDDGYTG